MESHIASSPYLVGLAKGRPSYEDSNVRSLIATALEQAGSPLDELIAPGMTICLKPNWIAGHREDRPDEWEQIITHPSVLRAVLSEVASRLREGRIVIADAPQTDSDFSIIGERSQLQPLLEDARAAYPDVEVSIIDLRLSMLIVMTDS